MAPHKVNVNTDYCTALPYCCYGTGQLTVSGVRAAEHVGVRGVAEALPSPGPQVAQVLVILQQDDDNNDDDSDDDDMMLTSQGMKPPSLKLRPISWLLALPPPSPRCRPRSPSPQIFLFRYFV